MSRKTRDSGMADVGRRRVVKAIGMGDAALAAGSLASGAFTAPGKCKELIMDEIGFDDGREHVRPTFMYQL